MALRYVTLAEIYAHLDRDTHPVPPADRITTFAEEQEDIFDNELRRRYTVPFTSVDNAEAFAQAKKVISARTAAAFIEWNGQQEGTRDEMWYVDSLRARAKDILEAYFTQREPDDADDAPSPYVLLPRDGLTTTDKPAVFTRAHCLPGDSGHW